jgi:excisionase family DNA binding protein
MHTTQKIEVGGATFLVTLSLTNNLLVSTAQERNGPDALLTAKQVGKILSLHPNTILKMARIGELEAVKVGKREKRFKPSVIDAWIRAHRHA